eukprot:7652265-Prorocentrum_lima.AAC.1
MHCSRRPGVRSCPIAYSSSCPHSLPCRFLLRNTLNTLATNCLQLSLDDGAHQGLEAHAV